MIKYLGSKRLLIPKIREAITDTLDKGTVMDLYSGTSRVGFDLRTLGYHVHANDYAAYAYTLANCYIAADAFTYLKDATEAIIDLHEGISNGNLKSGFFTHTYSDESWFFQKENAQKIEAIRNRIENMNLTDEVFKAILLTSLIEAADRVDSTCGVQMAYLKHWSKRSFNPLSLRVPSLGLTGSGTASNMLDTECLKTYTADLTYLDPPYNQHSYLGNYHIWETLVKWDAPEVYGKARKRVDTKTHKSLWNSSKYALTAFKQVVELLKSKYVVMSFNSTGYLSKQQIEDTLGKKYSIRTYAIEHPAYIGHKIGISNKSGVKVGTPSSSHVTEFLFVGTLAHT